MKTDALPMAVRAPAGNPLKWITKTAKDGLSNLITGLGSMADRNKKTRIRPNGIIADEELEDIYVDDGLGANIVNMLPDDMFREGWEYEFPDEDPIKAEELTDEYAAVLENIKAVAKIREGFYWARLYGGAAILIGALDGQALDQPLKPGRIRSFEYLRVIDRSDIQFANIVFQLDPGKPRYSLPEFYPIAFTTPLGSREIRKVHHTRIIEIHGNPIPAGATRYLNEQRYWGISVLQNVEDKLSQVGTSIAGIGHLLHEFSVGKYKLKGLAEILSHPDGAELIKKMVEVNDMTRSVFHSMYFDKEDDFYRENVSFAGVPEVLHTLFMLVSSCTGYPITRLFGMSPAGMNATGESDMRNYYDKVRSKQAAEAAPILLRLVRIISEWKGLPEPYIKWLPLQSLSQKEQAEMEEKKAATEMTVANTYQAWINAGVMEPYEARYLQFGDTLDKIPVPEDLLPAVPSLPEVPPGEDKGQEGEDDKGGGDEPDEYEELRAGIAEMKIEDVEARIAELEEKGKLSEDGEMEIEILRNRLRELDKKSKESKAAKPPKGGKK